jgi:hypothetical protein
MQHLDVTRLAAFDHDLFTDDERAHLAACAHCRSERDTLAQLVAHAGRQVAQDIAVDAPRLVAWEQLARGLRDEGLLTTGEHAQPDLTVESTAAPTVIPAARAAGAVEPRVRSVETPVSSRRWFVQLRQAAAALALLAGGAAMGRITRDVGGALPLTQAASLQTVGLREDGFESVGEATEVLNRAQRDYERASLWLAANDTTMHDSDVYRARLAALDQMMAASRAALRDAPQDPVLNHYYLSAYTAREATLQALSSALPVDKIIERY